MSTLDNLVRVVDALARPINERDDGLWRTENAAEAWEILAERGVIPLEAVDDPRREFVCSCGIVRVLDAAHPCRGRGVCSRPATIANVVTLAARWASVLAAEELTRVVARRLAPWGVAAVERIVWRTGERSDRMPAEWPHDANDHAGIVDDRAWDNRCGSLSANGEPYPWWRAHSESWEEYDARQGECPHAAYLAILRLGLSVDRIGDGEAVLVCPTVLFPAAEAP